MRPRGVVPAANCFLPLVSGLLATACFTNPPQPDTTGRIGGRVLLAPGVGLEGARVVVTQVNLYDGKGAVRKPVGATMTDADGNFPALATGITNGLFLLETSGGMYTDMVNGARIELDPSVHFRAIHWLGLFEDRSTTAWITPVHAFVEARFRHQVDELHDTIKASNAAYEESNRQFGGLDWEKVIPADLRQQVTSPTDAVRASFVLGGLAVLSDDLRQASQSSPQVVGLTILVAAMAADAADGDLDGNDRNAIGTGLQVGDCPPVDARCVPQGTGCTLGACRTACDVYANTYRTQLSDSISKFVGPRAQPTPWNKTGLGSEDARNLVDGVAKNTDKGLFGGACVDTTHKAPPTIVWEMAPKEGDLVNGLLTLHVRAIDTDGTRAPTITFEGGYQDTDGHPDNDVATVSINTATATNQADGPLTVSVTATGAAGNQATASRTFMVDNTAPSVTLDSGGLLVDGNAVWWTDTPGPTIRGMVTDMHGPLTVQVTIGGRLVATTVVDGPQWSVKLPDDAVPASGADMQVVASDKLGNSTTLSRAQPIRLDATPPSLTVDKSEVVDELASTFDYPEDSAGTKIALHRPSTTRVDLAAAVNGACPTIRKHLQLLYSPKADGTHGILGSAGELNPLTVNVVASDDGVGIVPSSVQYRVLLNSGEILPWTNLPQVGARYVASLYVDGPTALPQLGTTNGEFHVELRVQDKFGRVSTQERCWNHFVMAPPLQETSPSGGEKATGFAQSLWSTSLNPAAGEFGDFTQKFLSSDTSTELAVWRERVKNYLGLPVYVRVEVPRPANGFSATVNREFRVMKSRTNMVPTSWLCGTKRNDHCPLETISGIAYTSDFNAPATQANLQFRGRLFLMSGNNLGAAAGACEASSSSQPCAVAADDTTQTYTFRIPPRTGTLTDTLPEYGVVTTLLPKVPAGGTNVLMAPSDGNSSASGPYGEFTFEGKTLTGKVDGTLAQHVCTGEEPGDAGEGQSGRWICNGEADIVQYRALARIKYQVSSGSGIVTLFSSAATPALSFAPFPKPGALQQDSALLNSSESLDSNGHLP